jgi:hypothetical protein
MEASNALNVTGDSWANHKGALGEMGMSVGMAPLGVYPWHIHAGRLGVEHHTGNEREPIHGWTHPNDVLFFVFLNRGVRPCILGWKMWKICFG